MATNVTSLLRKGPSSASRWMQVCSSALTMLVIARLQHPSLLRATDTPCRSFAFPHPRRNFRTSPQQNGPEPFECGILSFKFLRKSVVLTSS